MADISSKPTGVVIEKKQGRAISAITSTWHYLKFPLMVGGLIIAFGAASALFSGAKAQNSKKIAPPSGQPAPKSQESQYKLAHASDADSSQANQLKSFNPALKHFYSVAIVIPKEWAANDAAKCPEKIEISPGITLYTVDLVRLTGGRPVKRSSSMWAIYIAERNVLVLGFTDPQLGEK